MDQFPVSFLTRLHDCSHTHPTQNHSRVFFWSLTGEIKYGTVKSTARLAHGTHIVTVELDGGEGICSLL
ncbi:hypothetical protein PISMIDRAFT_104600 [Pisolithus microcarpus 441]|uniref:Uncharacterized protein n=1 Tax=Pisolithus microcarpus 441 TaxID=765257 RepID=A0A0C9YWD0_9AGAM|nr:hypothetical protein BKA83DRAFT_104600 [Pisolithus microcarpus]KIK21071.1 hypothetical protein PISMIDRAFT_104600 [Pisolithus microcarpus 441]